MPATTAPLQADPGPILPLREAMEGSARPRSLVSEAAASLAKGSTAARSRAALRSAIPALLLGLLCLGLFFHEEVAAAVSVWARSTAYNHCFLVVPIVAYLAWDRRALLRNATLSPSPWLSIAGLPVALAWLVAERIGLMEARQLIVLCFIELLFLSVLGWPICRRLSAPLLYLFLLVPFGAFAVPLLQSITAQFTVTGLNALGVPNYVEGNAIEIAGGTFYIAEACAGLRFLIAAFAFGVLYALLMYRSPRRRAVFILAALIVPVIANGFRALGIVVLGNVLGSAEAAATDHVLYGWAFFSIVLVLLTILGLPFRQDAHFGAEREPETPNRPAPQASPLLAAYAVLLVAVTGPAIAKRLDEAARTPPNVASPFFTTPASCTPEATASHAEGPSTLVPSRAFTLRFLCGSQQIAVQIEVFPARISPSRIAAERRRMIGKFDGEDTESVVTTAGGTEWLLTGTENPPRITATALWIDGKPADGGLAVRVQQARNSLFGSPLSPVLISVTAGARNEADGMAVRDQRALLQSFLDTQTNLPAQIESIAASAARSEGGN
jgi:exosortase A